MVSDLYVFLLFEDMMGDDLDLNFIRSGLSGRLVSLTGMMGSGKSSIGVLIADILEFPFIDNDLEVEDRFGMSIEDIFSHYGESEFRVLERRCLELVLASMQGSFIFALGGGIFMNAGMRSLYALGGYRYGCVFRLIYWRLVCVLPHASDL